MAISARNAGLAVALLLSASLALAGCDNGAPQQAAAPATVPAVTVVKVVSKDLRPSVSFSARVEALHKVDLLARIQGYLDKQNFAEGASVKAGDLLYVIEQAPYQATVAAAEASVAVAAARLDRTEIELKRQTTLVSKEASAQTKLDDARTARNEAKGQYDKLMAELDQAKLQLSYTEIKAPIDGRIGKSLLSVGSFVSPQSGTLATIVKQNPIGVTFPVSQRDIMAVRE
ncbi:MAG: efflux RND transporter periplasmic adaptor subunit, partial [Alphaproteobacteria bacterium]|nr:efflux RND transporter periplasmic adaptor subunit [Alphaproteobacteria bacterium]